MSSTYPPTGPDEDEMVQMVARQPSLDTGNPAEIEDTATEWRLAGFSPADAEEYVEAGCFDAGAAAVLRELGCTPEIAARSTLAGLGSYEGTIGYKAANNDLSVEQIKLVAFGEAS